MIQGGNNMNVYGATSISPVGSNSKKNNVENSVSNSDSKKTTSHKESESQIEVAATYEKGPEKPEKKVNYKTDLATVERLKAESEERANRLRELIHKMMTKQGQTFHDANMYTFLREGKYEVDEETRLKAREDISEDGFYGIKQTSERLVSFAKALTGGDPTKADEMIAAVKKGFEEATKAWGGELPEICKNTIDETIKQLEDWKNSIETK